MAKELPTTFEEIMREISRQANVLSDKGSTPQVVELGRVQQAALRQAGHPGATTITVVITRGLTGNRFSTSGESYPATSGDIMTLSRRPVDDESHLEVTDR
jgi:hypothetical protein